MVSESTYDKTQIQYLEKLNQPAQAIGTQNSDPVSQEGAMRLLEWMTRGN